MRKISGNLAVILAYAAVLAITGAGDCRASSGTPAVSGAVPSDRHSAAPAGPAAVQQKGGDWVMQKEPVAVDVTTLKSLPEVIRAVEGKRIVYVGEFHDQVSHHTVELQVIKGLFQRDPRIAVGMEMFQRPFQHVLDEFILGAIDERAFLKRSEYFRRWVYDYHLYKPILDFARENKIPVVALNLRQELVDKTAKSGLASLTDSEKKEIPSQIDLTDTAYRDRLKKVFEQHQGESERSFDFFYQSQVLWDETMSMSIDEYLRKNPDRRMVVLTGQGHIVYGSGIPKRTFRRDGFAYTTILNDPDVEKSAGDYLVYPPEEEGPTAPKLGVLLGDVTDKPIITGFTKDSIAEQAGLRAGDVIQSINGAPVSSLADLKLELFYTKPADVVTVQVVRKRFLLGSREMTFAVKLP